MKRGLRDTFLRLDQVYHRMQYHLAKRTTRVNGNILHFNDILHSDQMTDTHTGTRRHCCTWRRSPS